MTPMPVNPTVLLLVGSDGTPLKIATNIDPELKVVVCQNEDYFNRESSNKPFVFTAQ